MTRQGQQSKRGDKELNAMRFNLKEQRVLQKNLHILDAEASYSLKLIDLNNRGVKVFYKRFKDKVSKIKSHLRAEEIAELREMESRGELKDMHKPLNITGALRIADAEKRLQLRGHERHRKTKSAFARRADMTSMESIASRDRPVSHSGVQVPTLSSILENKRSSINDTFVLISDKNNNANRRSSIGSSGANDPITQVQVKNSTGIDNSLLVEGKSSNMSTKGLKHLVEKSAWSSTKSPREVSSIPGIVKHDEDNQRIRFHDTKPENSMAVPRVGDGNLLNESHSAKKRSMSVSFANGTEFKAEKTKHVTIADESPIETPVSRIHSLRSRSGTSRTSNYTRSSSQASSSALSFSCHSNTEKDYFGEHNGLKTATLYSSNDDMSPYIGENPYEERRKMLLQGEQYRADTLADRKDDFLDRVDEYIKVYEKQNAALQLDIERQQSELRGLVDDQLDELLPAEQETLTRAQIKMLKNRKMMQEQMMMRKKSTKELWKDINKCTYLRVPSEKIDLSGIVTLASEQMKLFKTLRPM